MSMKNKKDKSRILKTKEQKFLFKLIQKLLARNKEISRSV